jgi:hypothetical protein
MSLFPPAARELRASKMTRWLLLDEHVRRAETSSSSSLLRRDVAPTLGWAHLEKGYGEASISLGKKSGTAMRSSWSQSKVTIERRAVTALSK